MSLFGWCLCGLTLCLLQLWLPSPVLAVRPFVTDDARVVGEKLVLLETSIRQDRERFENLNLLAYGPTENLEITVGFVDGIFLEGEDSWKVSAAGPLAQGKYLFTEGAPKGCPGVALAAGVGTPYGSNHFGNPSWSGFSYLAFTESLDEKESILIHANIGLNYARPDSDLSWKYTPTWGVGTQVHLFGGLHGVGEIFFGDPYSGDTGGNFQAGFRYFISQRVQIDATMGSGLWGENKLNTWFGCGLRIIFDFFH